MKRNQETKKAIITIVMTSLSVFMAAETSLAVPMSGHLIIIVPRPDTPGSPRTPVVNPFIAEFMDGSTSILLGATDSIGTVYVQITSTAGDNYSTYFDTSDGAILLPISGDAGNYTMTITASGGSQYVGEFTI